MTEEKVFTHFTDPAHGWIKVSKQLLKELGIATKITAYSYQKGDYAYLEEDCDASLFVEEYEKQTGQKIKTVTSYAHRSAIRNFQSYKP